MRKSLVFLSLILLVYGVFGPSHRGGRRHQRLRFIFLLRRSRISENRC